MGIFQKLSTLLKSNLNDMISRAENPEKMLNQLITDANRKLVKLDLSEVTLVDVDVVRFFGDQERQGIELVKCSPYVREWIQREQTVNSGQQEDDPESKEGE